MADVTYDDPGMPFSEPEESDDDFDVPPPPSEQAEDVLEPPSEPIEPPAPLTAPVSDEAMDTPAPTAAVENPTPLPPPAVPVLRGRFFKNAVGSWVLRGVWTMTEHDTVSSDFEFVKRADPVPPEPVAPPADGSDAPPTATRANDDAPPSGIYDGYFMMKRLHLPEAKIAELGVKFTIRPLAEGETIDVPGNCTVLQPGDWYTFGEGQNEFGTFELRGRYVPATNEVFVGKSYVTVNLVPVPASAAKKSKSHASSQAKRTAPTPKPAGPPKPRSAPTPKPAATPITPVTPALSAEEAARREQRKRAVPSHLRDALTPGGLMSGPFMHCAKILEQLISHQFAYPFLNPVDPVALNIPDYPRVIKRPMDLGTIRHKLDNGAYMTHDEFASDVRITFDNAMLYNAPGTDIYNMADRLKKKFDEQWRLLGRAMDRDGGGGGGFKSSYDSDDDSPKHAKKPTTPHVSGGGGGMVTRPSNTAPAKPKSAPSAQKKRVRPPSDPTPAKRPAPAPAPSMAYVDPGFGVGASEVAELKSELQALRMQLRMMAQVTANAQMQGVPNVRFGELTYEEKRELSMRINQLDTDKLAKVVQIIAERMPLGAHSATDDIEIDIDALDVDTLRRLQDFVKVRRS